MEDQIVTFETAKLAKEKGFDIPTLFWYFLNSQAGLDYLLVDYIGEGQFGIVSEKENHNQGSYIITRFNAPTQSLLQKWLREKHKIDITVSLVAGDYGFYIHNNRNYTNKGENYGISGTTYELALEQGLQEALKLIK